MCGGGGQKGPSAAELEAISRRNNEAELAKIKSEQEFQAKQMEQQLLSEKEIASMSMAQQKQQFEMQQVSQQKAMEQERAKQEQALLDEKSQQQLQVQMERQAQVNQSELNSEQLAKDQARRSSQLQAFWYLDNDDTWDEANKSTKQKRKSASILA